MAAKFDPVVPTSSNPQTAEEVKLLNPKQLNIALRKHGIACSGKREHKIRLLCDVLSIDVDKSNFQQVLTNVRNTKQGWTKDLRNCPPVSLPEVTDYLLRCHDTIIHTKSGNIESFTAQNLKRYKTLRSYDLYRSGHVHSIRFQPMSNTNYCALQGKCNPSWDTSGTVYDCLIILKHNGQPIGSSCTCTAGLGEACTHVAGILFAMEDFTSLGYHTLPGDPAITELLCTWNSPKTPKVEAVPLNSLTYQCRAPGNLQNERRYTKKRLADHNPVNPAKRGIDGDSYVRLVHTLHLCQPDAPFCTIADPHRWKNHISPSTDQKIIPNPALPPLMSGENLLLIPASEETVVTSTREPLNIVSQGIDFMSRQRKLHVTDEVVGEFLKWIKISESEQQTIEALTRGQSKNPKWKVLRKGRITSTTVHAVHTRIKSVKAGRVSDAERLVANILGTSKTYAGNEHTQYGLVHENAAAQDYYKLMQQKHDNFLLEECGFQVLLTHPFIGASVDRVAKCSCHAGARPIEIKCPSTMQHLPRGSFIKLPFICEKNGVLTLKSEPTPHPYFTQIQCHMAVMDSLTSDFVVWSPQEMLVIKVDFDQNYWSSVLSNAEYFFCHFVAPKIFQLASEKPHVEFHSERDDFVKQYVCGRDDCRSLLVDIENLNNNADASVMCECICGCGVWYHWRCSSLHYMDIEDSNNSPKWYCPVCISSCNALIEE